MQKQAVLMNGVIDSKQALEKLRSDFPWSKQWKVNVSGGFVGVVNDLFADIQDILGATPAIDYLYVFDEKQDENDEQKKLCIFIEPHTKIRAKCDALEHVVLRTVKVARAICQECGGRLERTRDLSPSDYPFLASQNDPFSKPSAICLFCAAQKWHQAQETERESASPNIEPKKVNSTAPSGQLEEDDEIHDALSIFDHFTADVQETKNDDEPEEQKTEEADSIEEQTVNRPKTVQVFSLKDIENLESEQKGAGRDREKQLKSLAKKLKDSGPEKRLASLPESWREYCNELLIAFPNFADVVRFISHQMALAAMGDGFFRLPPILLMGPPGIGKTEFLLTIANDLSSKLEIIDMSSAQTGSPLTGSEAHWSNTQTGTLFNLVALGEIANPIILLDEIDKIRKDGAYNPLSALHALLEPRQARQFKDLSVPFLPFDASHVVWAATGNDIEFIEKPILDRFSVFEINEPSAEQMYAIAQNQYRRVVERYTKPDVFETTLTPETMAEITKFRPRQVRKILESAIGRAAFHQRNYLTVEDIKECSQSTTEKRRSSIGFL